MPHQMFKKAYFHSSTQTLVKYTTLFIIQFLGKKYFFTPVNARTLNGDCILITYGNSCANGVIYSISLSNHPALK